MTFGVDYAWGRPGVRALEAAHVQFAARYLSHDTTGKNLTRGEAQQLSDAGMWLLVVFEDGATRALDGYGAGRLDAQFALAQAEACGMPAGRPIYFAVDFDAGPADEAAINAYLDGAASVLGKDRVGIYGGYYPVKSALAGGHCKWGWQTYAWSGGLWWPGAQLHQYSNDHIIGGVDLDYDEAPVGDYGQWRVGVSPTPQPQQPAAQEDDMPQGHLLQDTTKKNTPISVPKDKYKAIGFIGDNGYLGLPPVELRLGFRVGKGNWQVHDLVVDSAADKATFNLPAGCDGITVSYKDPAAAYAAVPVAYDLS